MAYLSFAETAGPLTIGSEPRPAPTSGFSALEWSVITLAQRDTPASLKMPGRIATALGTLFGTARSIRLADQRLEALRRMAVLAWRNSYVVPLSEIRAFKSAGFTIEQYETLQSSISQGRAKLRTNRA